MQGPRTNFGTNIVQPGSVPAYATGGAIDESLDDNPLMRAQGTQMSFDIKSALGVINDVLNFGRSQYGLGSPADEQQEGGQQEAADHTQQKLMPANPGRETPVERPMPNPNAFPYAPGEKPFGRRADAEGAIDEGDEQEAAPQQMAGLTPKVLPAAPGSYTPMERPMPMGRDMPPTANPFGKRVSEADIDQGGEMPEDPNAGAIDTEETA